MAILLVRIQNGEHRGAPRRAAVRQHKCLLVANLVRVKCYNYRVRIRRIDAMANSNVQKRLQALEAEIAEIKRRLGVPGQPSTSWLDQWWGAFANDPAFEEAMRLGAQWRKRENAKSLRK